MTTENNNSKTTQLPQKHSDSEIYQVMATILNISEEQISDNINLFQNINNRIFTCLYYLSKMQDEQDIISATYSLEFVYNFKKGVDDYLA